MKVVKERTLMPACVFSAGQYVADGVETFLLLDLDGVFVPYSYSTKPKQFFALQKDDVARYPNRHYDKRSKSQHFREPKSFELRWSRELVGNLKKVVSDPTVQTVWVTTWREDMGGVVKLMNLISARPMVYLPWGESDKDFNHSLKVESVNTFLNRDKILPSTKVVWVDDIALKNVNEDDEMFHQLKAGNVLLIKPDSEHGVSLHEWGQVDTFLKR